MTIDELIAIVKKHDGCDEMVCLAHDSQECNLADAVRVLTKRLAELDAASVQIAERDRIFRERLESAIDRMDAMLALMQHQS